MVFAPWWPIIETKTSKKKNNKKKTRRKDEKSPKGKPLNFIPILNLKDLGYVFLFY
jgi:hypothetical protein